MHKYPLEEVETITEAVDAIARCAVVVANWTALSFAELRGLKWEDINWKKRQLNVMRTVRHRESAGGSSRNILIYGLRLSWIAFYPKGMRPVEYLTTSANRSRV